MQVYVKVRDGERFALHTVRTKDELRRILDFARIGSQNGEPRSVYKLPRNGRPQLIARYENGESRTSKVMRARRNPLWGLAAVAAFAGLKRIITG